MKDSFKKKLTRSRLTCTGHVERMEGEKLAKSVDAQKVEPRGKGDEEVRNCDGALHRKRHRKNG